MLISLMAFTENYFLSVTESEIYYKVNGIVFIRTLYMWPSWRFGRLDLQFNLLNK